MSYLARLCSIVRNLQYSHSQSSAARMETKQYRDYKDAISALNSLQTNAQYVKQASREPIQNSNIQQVKKFLNRSGVTLDQLDTLPVIHITGTNGKGSTCAYSESILRSHGYKTGFYSSPHLLDVRERIRINGKPVSKKIFLEYFWKIYDLLDQQKESPEDMPLYFRYLTIVAFHIFLAEKVDVALIEVGIGGEYDCTNVIRKTAVAAITSLDLDHTALLGNSLESIAWNKCGIMKEGALFFCFKQPENIMNIIKDRSVERKCRLQVLDHNCFNGKFNSQIPELCQQINGSLALAICEAFMQRDGNNNKQFSLELATKCIENTKWPGRYEIIEQNNLRFFLDGAHTLNSIQICKNWFMSNTIQQRKKVLIFNLTGDRDPNLFFKELESCRFDIVIFCPNIGSLDGQDSIDNKDLISPLNKQMKRCEENKELWMKLQNSNSNEDTVRAVTSFSHAVQTLPSTNSFDILVTGSIHLIGAALYVLNPTLGGALAD